MAEREPTLNLSELFHSDETAWLEHMATLAATGDTAPMDLRNLSEYLSDMARRDKRETLQRLATLLVHLLKWEHQPAKRSRSWDLTIQEQREELEDLLGSRVLRNHAEQELARAYQKAVRRVAVETELPEETFPKKSPYTLEQVLGGCSAA